MSLFAGIAGAKALKDFQRTSRIDIGAAAGEALEHNRTALPCPLYPCGKFYLQWTDWIDSTEAGRLQARFGMGRCLLSKKYVF